MNALKAGLSGAADKAKEAAIEKVLDEIWELMPGYLQCLCCCGSTQDKVLRINSCCGCLVPEAAQPLMEKLVKLIGDDDSEE
jgi:hypothetical protein